MKNLVPEYIKKIVPYKAGKPMEELERELGITNSVKMASNENPIGPSKKAVDAIANHLNSIHFYPDGGGFYLKQLLAQKLGVSEENLFLGNGSNEVIEMVAKTFMDPGKTAVMAESSFVVYKIITQTVGATSIEVPLENFTHALPKMADAITKNTRVIFIANPNNPTGTIVCEDEMDAFLKRVPDNVLVVVDEAYYEYVEEETFPDVLSKINDRENLIIMRTFSKIYGLAGLRIGYGIGHKKVIDFMNRVRQPFNVNMLAQVGALAALKDEEHLIKSKEINNAGKKSLYDTFCKMGIEYVPTHTNFILFKVPGAKEVYDKLLHKGVIVRPMGGYNLPDYLRVTIGLDKDNQRFIQELKNAIKT